MGTPKINITGRQYGSWTVYAYAGKGRWVCICACGAVGSPTSKNLRYGKSTACTRCRVQKIATAVTRHGHSRVGRRTAEYGIWKGIKTRCFNPRRREYADYGGRGITLCDRWMVYENFYSDMGPRPSASYTVERVDNDGNYEPSNCKWIPRSEQARNTRRTKRAT